MLDVFATLLEVSGRGAACFYMIFSQIQMFRYSVSVYKYRLQRFRWRETFSETLPQPCSLPAFGPLYIDLSNVSMMLFF